MYCSSSHKSMLIDCLLNCLPRSLKYYKDTAEIPETLNQEMRDLICLMLRHESRRLFAFMYVNFDKLLHKDKSGLYILTPPRKVKGKNAVFPITCLQHPLAKWAGYHDKTKNLCAMYVSIDMVYPNLFVQNQMYALSFVDPMEIVVVNVACYAQICHVKINILKRLNKITIAGLKHGSGKIDLPHVQP